MQVGPTSEHRPVGGGTWGLPTASSPLHKGRAQRGRTGGWVHAKRAGSRATPLWARALKKKAQAQRAQAFHLAVFD